MLDQSPLFLHLLFSLTSLMSLLFVFYFFIKKSIFKFAPVLAARIDWLSQYPLTQAVGMVELSLVAICHVIFCLLLLFWYQIPVIQLVPSISILSWLSGVLIGMGSVGISVLLCSTAMKCLEKIAKNKVPTSLSGWVAISNAGWIRHHKHTIKILPFFIALFIISLQIGSEETIFRSVLLTTLSPYGVTFAFVVATVLFIFMQTLHMPSLLSAMFPVIGATVMGITHGLLYLYHPAMMPLIISHLTFFIFTVI